MLISNKTTYYTRFPPTSIHSIPFVSTIPLLDHQRELQRELNEKNIIQDIIISDFKEKEFDFEEKEYSFTR